MKKISRSYPPMSEYSEADRVWMALAGEGYLLTWRCSLRHSVDITKHKHIIFKEGQMAGFLNLEEAVEWLKGHKDSLETDTHELLFAYAGASASPESRLMIYNGSSYWPFDDPNDDFGF